MGGVIGAIVAVVAVIAVIILTVYCFIGAKRKYVDLHATILCTQIHKKLYTRLCEDVGTYMCLSITVRKGIVIAMYFQSSHTELYSVCHVCYVCQKTTHLHFPICDTRNGQCFALMYIYQLDILG